MELTACAPTTGACRVVVHEEWTPSWVTNRPTMQFLSDNKRFLWESERTGWRNYYLYDFSAGKLLADGNEPSVRGRRHRQGRREGERALLHGARRRQPHEAAAPPRRSRRQRRSSPHRPDAQPRGDVRAERQVLRRCRADARQAARDHSRDCRWQAGRDARDHGRDEVSSSSGSSQPSSTRSRRRMGRRSCTGCCRSRRTSTRRRSIRCS